MENDEKVEKPEADPNADIEERKLLLSRRDFLSGLRKWSAAAIGVAIVGGLLLPEDAEASGWVNGRGAWVNGHGGGGGAAWVNRGGGGGGTAWANRGSAWANRGAAWLNKGGGGSTWVNRRGW